MRINTTIFIQGNNIIVFLHKYINLSLNMNKKTNHFSSEVIDSLKSYVYKLIDPRDNKVFYIGKGKGDRIFHHANNHLSDDEKDDYDENIDLKLKRIKEIYDAGLEVKHVIHRHGLDNETAYHVEAALIDEYPELLNVQGGYHSSDLGPKTVEQIREEYEILDVADSTKHKVLLINVNRSFKNNDDLYNAVRFAWKLKPENAEKADYVLAIEKGIIRGVFIADEWHKARKEYFPEFENRTNKRYGLIGRKADDEIANLYIGKRIPDEFRKKGTSNPIKYNFAINE